MDKTSMLYWYPKIADLPIRQPQTEWVKVSQKEFRLTMEGMPDSLLVKTMNLIKNKFQMPVFIRTDFSSGKHYWEKTCYYDGSKGLQGHLFEICEFNHCADMMGLPFTAIVVREFIPMNTYFTAFFGKMPINPERRYFINDHKVICHHPYWIPEAIEQVSHTPNVKNWIELLKEVNTETESEIILLTEYASLVAERFKDYWSVDFCQAQNGDWILIDMAEGGKSWHPECDKRL